MALNIAGNKPKEEKPVTPSPKETKSEPVVTEEKDSKAEVEKVEAAESTPPKVPFDEWGLKITDRFSVVRQRESFMLIEHRPSEDKDGNKTTKAIKTYHPTVEQVLGKMAKVHTLDLLEQEEVDKFADALSHLTTTLRETVGPLLDAADGNHKQASTLGGNVYLDFMGRLKTGLKVAEKSEAFEVDGQQVMPVEAVYKAIETEFPGGKDES